MYGKFSTAVRFDRKRDIWRCEGISISSFLLTFKPSEPREANLKRKQGEVLVIQKS